MALQGFEARIERMVDGVFSRAFRSSLKPIELGRRLVREMDNRRTLDVHGRAVVPNIFSFALSPADHHAFAAIEAPLVRELVDAAKEHARDEGYGFLGPLRVELQVDDALRSGRFLLTAELSAGARTSAKETPPPAPSPPAAAPPAAAVAAAPSPPDVAPLIDAPLTEAPSWASEGPAWGAGLPVEPGPVAAAEPPTTAAPAAPAASISVAFLVEATGIRHELRAGEVALIGRLPGSAVVVTDANVSRRHAEVRPRPDGGWTIADLGSTNGTRVNGASVSEHPLGDGDVITVGGTRVRFEVR